MLRSLVSRRQLQLGTLLVWLLVPLLLWWVVRSVPLGRIWAALSGLGWPQIAALLALNTLVLLSFSGRWWTILRGQGTRIPYLALTGYRLAAFGVSYFTPGPQLGGEPLQAYLLKRRQGVPGATATASVALDRLLEIVVNFAFLFTGVSLTLQQRAFGGQLGWEALALALVLLSLPVGFLVALWGGLHPLSWLAGHAPGWLRNLDGYQVVSDLVNTSEAEAARFCRERPLHVVAALMMSLLSWALLLVEVWLALRFLGLGLSPLQLVVILTAARIAFLLPLPGGLGTLEASQVLAFQALGFDPALGLTFSLVVRARDVLFGAIGLWWGGMLIGKRDYPGRL